MVGKFELGVKTERNVKAEFPRSFVKAEPHAGGDRASRLAALKAEHRVKAELKVKKDEEDKKGGIKVERKSESSRSGAVKAESVKSEFNSGIKALLERGLHLRSMAAKASARVKSEAGRGRVKKEKSARKTGKRGPKRRVTAARRNASREAINREVPLSQDLADVVGARALSRPEAVKRFWAHCREEGLLNPADKRQILFNPKLEQLFGRSSARITDLMGLLTPHFEYAKSEPKLEPTASAAAGVKAQPPACKGEPARVKRPCEDAAAPVKRPCKDEAAEAPRGRGRPCKAEAGAAAAAPKAELKAEINAGVKAERVAPAALGEADLADLARGLVPRLSGIGRSSVRVECEVSSGAVSLRAVATPLNPGGAPPSDVPAVVSRACAVDFREAEGGHLQPWGDAELQGLRPEVAYRVCVEVLPPGAAGAAGAAPGPAPGPAPARSAEVSLPQRAAPAKWTAQEALQWITSLQVPELARKAREYAVDGPTLLALGDEDLTALGLAAPFLRKRVLQGIQALRDGGV